MNLSQLALIGAESNSIFEDLGIDIKTTFDKALEKYNDEEPLRRFQLAMTETKAEIMEKAPVWMRLNLIANSLSEKDYDRVDWKLINEMLGKNSDAFDFNVFDPVTDADSFRRAYANFISSTVISTPWRKERCKDCGRTYYMTREEMSFFAKKELALPKRCQTCRDGRRCGKEPVKAEKKVVLVGGAVTGCETAMEVAIRKAKEKAKR